MADRTATLVVRDALVAVILAGDPRPMDATGHPILAPECCFRDDDDLTNAANRLEQQVGGLLPDGEGGGYFLFGETGELNGGFYAEPGHDGAQRIHGWTTTKDNALRLYGWLKARIDGVALPLGDGHTMVTGSLVLVTTQADTNGIGRQAMMDYAVESTQ